MKRVQKYIGSYLVELKRDLDALGCTAGGREGDKLFGPLVTDGLQSLGIDVDPTKFAPNDGEGGEMHFNLSRTKAMVVPTQEEFSIAEQSLEACGLRASERRGRRNAEVAWLRTVRWQVGSKIMRLVLGACATSLWCRVWANVDVMQQHFFTIRPPRNDLCICDRP